ncbi:MAG: hydroxymethylglutaryl-CoA reductase [Saprospiraceae bacterium]|jgi:hydroxymethylglutaryl-CoA reductase|nr:hydroxymethylglutaryl-CoA reductase [Saprospiraceae bacterium]
MAKTISGFSKLSKRQKIEWLAANFFQNPVAAEAELVAWHRRDEAQQRIIDGFTENAVSNFTLPFSVAPNFLINGRAYAVPMVIEESSVVAAASSAAKFWLDRGGFHAEVCGVVKLGQVHFRWAGRPDRLRALFPALKTHLVASSNDLTAKMRQRGGGLLDIELLDFTHIEPEYYQFRASFNTCDSMGANFINSVLERFGEQMEFFMETAEGIADHERDVEVLMCILSNYNPNCLVRAWVECSENELEDLARDAGLPGHAAVDRFCTAVRIAAIDPYRATTHNKGIFNGIDAVILATGNDFRAVEACGHTYACRSGQYRSLSRAWVENGLFRFELELPLPIGTVGGLTALHPLAKQALDMLGNPSAQDLMMIVAAVGLAQNFAAVRSLVTTGIQQGHMRMHLVNILNHLGATEDETTAAQAHFCRQTVSFSGVRTFLENARSGSGVT